MRWACLIALMCWAGPAAAAPQRLALEPAQVTLVPGGRAQFRAYLIHEDGRRQRTRVELSATGGVLTASGDFTAGAKAGQVQVRARTGPFEATAQVRVARAKAVPRAAGGHGPALVVKAWRQRRSDQVAFVAKVARGQRLEVQGVTARGRLHTLRTWDVTAGERVVVSLPVLPGAYVAIVVHAVDSRGRRLGEFRHRLRR